jgi:signal transduction histidine kinase
MKINLLKIKKYCLERNIKMKNYSFLKIKENQKEKNEKIRNLESKLVETKKNFDQILINKTLDINLLLRDKARFIDNLCHDLATPLTPIISLLPLVKEEVSDSKLNEIIDTCIRSAEYIKRVINNSRELADISTTDLLLKKENLYELINIIIKKYDIIFKTNKIQVINKVRKDFNIKTEKNRFLQLLDHVTSNAVNSMSDGGLLSFKSKPIQKDSELYFHLSIKDTGNGLSREQTNRIFDEFYKTDESRHKLDSTGLGLSICKKIIEKHNGKIWADSHGKGTGTTINLIIPSSEIIYDRSF